MTKPLLKTRNWVDAMERSLLDGGPPLPLDDIARRELQNIVNSWREIVGDDVSFGLRQKGVDMRMGLDIASITLKQQADTLVLVTGDSDFVPAAKLARREGMEFLLDPLWQSVSDDLNEHVDGVISGFPRPASENIVAAAG